MVGRPRPVLAAVDCTILTTRAEIWRFWICICEIHKAFGVVRMAGMGSNFLMRLVYHTVVPTCYSDYSITPHC